MLNAFTSTPINNSSFKFSSQKTPNNLPNVANVAKKRKSLSQSCSGKQFNKRESIRDLTLKEILYGNDKENVVKIQQHPAQNVSKADIHEPYCTPPRVAEENNYIPNHVRDRINRDINSPSATANLRAKQALRNPEDLRKFYGVVEANMEEKDFITEEERNAPLPPPTPKTTAELFKDCIFYVEIRTERDNRSLGIKQKLIDMGAAVNDKLYINTTHCIFKDGLVSSYQLAKRRNIPVVSLLWIEECKKYMRLVDTEKYKIYNSERYENPELFKIVRRMKSMQPDGVTKEIKKPEVAVKAKFVDPKKTVKVKQNPLPVVPKSVKVPVKIVVPEVSQSSIAITGSRRTSSRLSVMPSKYRTEESSISLQKSVRRTMSSVVPEESIENIEKYVKEIAATVSVSSSCRMEVSASCSYQQDVVMEKMSKTPSHRTIIPASFIQKDVIMENEDDVIIVSSEESIPTQINPFNSPNSMETVIQKKVAGSLKIQQDVRKRITTYTPQQMEETLNTKKVMSRRTTFANLNMTEDVNDTVVETPIRRSRFFDQIQSASILPFNSTNKVGKFERRSMMDLSMSILNNNMSIVNSQSKKDQEDVTPKAKHLNELHPKRLLMNDSIDSVQQTVYVDPLQAKGVKSPNDIHQEKTLVNQFKDINEMYQKTINKRRLYNVEEDYERSEENVDESLKKPEAKKCKTDVGKPMSKKKALVPGINRVKKVVKKNTPVTPLSQPLATEDDDKNDTLKFFKVEIAKKTPLRTTASKKPLGPAKKYIVSTSLTPAEQETLKEAVKRFGGKIQSKVDEKTTHVISGNGNRTMTLLRGFARGAYVLQKTWVEDSLDRGHWLDNGYSFYVFKEWPKMQIIERKHSVNTYVNLLFHKMTPFYIHPKGDVGKINEYTEELIVLCGGSITKNIMNCRYIITEYYHENVPKYNEQGDEINQVIRQFAMDSIIRNYIVDYREYLAKKQFAIPMEVGDQ
ncbi:unnamed protein product [Diamesa tonsa]